MGLVLTLLRILLPPLLVVLGFGYAAYRITRALEEHFLGPSLSTGELAKSASRAQEILARIRKRLPETEEGASILLDELEGLVETRLPGILERQRLLLEHLSETRNHRLPAEERDLSKRLSQAKDPELRDLLQENLRLLERRREEREALELASRKMDAQISSILIHLESFEDHLVATRFGDLKGKRPEIAALVEDVHLLEEAYDELGWQSKQARKKLSWKEEEHGAE